MKNISLLSLLAVSKLVETEIKARGERPNVGRHTVSDEVRIGVDGTVNVSADEEYTPTVKIPLKAAFALFVRYSGITGEHALNALQKAMSEALTLDEEAQEKIAEIAVLDAAQQKVSDMLGSLPKAKRSGKVTIKVTGAGDRILPEAAE